MERALLPKPLPGAEWQIDQTFNLADELLRDPELKLVLKAVREKGAEIVIRPNSSSTSSR
jgi:hypothetical protein